MSLIVGIYTVLIGIFLLIQMVAFVWAHVVYQDDVEDAKMQVFTCEKDVL